MLLPKSWASMGGQSKDLPLSYLLMRQMVRGRVETSCPKGVLVIAHSPPGQKREVCYHDNGVVSPQLQLRGEMAVVVELRNPQNWH